MKSYLYLILWNKKTRLAVIVMMIAIRQLVTSLLEIQMKSIYQFHFAVMMNAARSALVINYEIRKTHNKSG